ncbi:MAG: DUF1801 domain-containing protein [Dehalococcoidia bacterium]|nr:MAG: DUF1801 domain-containing protein [Dehalococcoidia bacterium]
MSQKTVNDYISELENNQGKIVSEIREIILKTAPFVKESIKWAQPVYENNGPFAYIKAFKNYVNLGFWRGVDIKDTKRLLKGFGSKMRHIKITGSNDIDELVFADYIRQAIALNKEKGDPTKGT